MIQIQSKQQFTKAIERARRERMLVRFLRFREYAVTNRTNGCRYFVTFEVKGGKRFRTCSCEAGTPMRGNHRPIVCKHLLAALTVHAALMSQRRGH